MSHNVVAMSFLRHGDARKSQRRRIDFQNDFLKATVEAAYRGIAK